MERKQSIFRRMLAALGRGLVRLTGACVTPVGLLVVAGMMMALFALPLVLHHGGGLLEPRTSHSIAGSLEVRPAHELKVYRLYDGDFLERSDTDSWYNTARHIYQWEAMIDFSIDLTQVKVSQEGDMCVIELPPLEHKAYDRVADIPSPHCDTIQGNSLLGNKLRKTVKRAVAEEIEWRIKAQRWDERARASAERLVKMLYLPSMNLPEEHIQIRWADQKAKTKKL